MPIYVYKCTQCNEYCEALQKASDEPKKICPACQAEALIKVIAPVGVIFKGTGFHKNDYSAKSSGSSSSSSSSKPSTESGSSSDSSSTTSESKPAASETKSSGDSGSSGSTGGGSDKVA